MTFADVWPENGEFDISKDFLLPLADFIASARQQWQGSGLFSGGGTLYELHAKLAMVARWEAHDFDGPYFPPISLGITWFAINVSFEFSEELRRKLYAPLDYARTYIDWHEEMFPIDEFERSKPDYSGYGPKALSTEQQQQNDLYRWELDDRLLEIEVFLKDLHFLLSKDPLPAGHLTNARSNQPPWSTPNTATFWAQQYNVTLKTMQTMLTDGSITVKPLGPRRFMISLDDLPQKVKEKLDNSR